MLRDLVEGGVLVRRDVDKDVSWWFNIPGVGVYAKQLCKGVVFTCAVESIM